MPRIIIDAAIDVAAGTIAAVRDIVVLSGFIGTVLIWAVILMEKV